MCFIDDQCHGDMEQDEEKECLYCIPQSDNHDWTILGMTKLSFMHNYYGLIIQNFGLCDLCSVYNNQITMTELHWA